MRRRIVRPASVRLIGIVLAVGVLVSGLYFARNSVTNPEAYGNDFNVYYYAAREVIAGRDPYQRSLGDWTPYIYPPLLAELMVPLALLPLPIAAYIWFLISAGSMAAAARMLGQLASHSRECDSAAALKQSDPRSAGILASLFPQQGNAAKDACAPRKPPSWRAAISMCAVIVVLRFVLDTLNLGQVNALMAGLAVAHVWLYARGRKALSALALVIAVSIKLTPALLVLYHIAKMRLRFAVACAALLVAVTVLSFLPFGANSMNAFRVFVNRTVKNEQGYDFGYAGNQSLRGAVERFKDRAKDTPSPGEGESRSPAEGVTLLISIGLLALAVFAARRAQTELAAVAPFFCCMVLLSPLSWKAHYAVLILPVAHLASRMKTWGRARYWIAATLIASFALFNLTSPRVIGPAAAEWADAHSLVLGGALIIFAAAIAIAVTCKFGKQPRVC